MVRLLGKEMLVNEAFWKALFAIVRLLLPPINVTFASAAFPNAIVPIYVTDAGIVTAVMG